MARVNYLEFYVFSESLYFEDYYALYLHRFQNKGMLFNYYNYIKNHSVIFSIEYSLIPHYAKYLHMCGVKGILCK